MLKALLAESRARQAEEAREEGWSPIALVPMLGAWFLSSFLAAGLAALLSGIIARLTSPDAVGPYRMPISLLCAAVVQLALLWVIQNFREGKPLWSRSELRKPITWGMVVGGFLAAGAISWICFFILDLRSNVRVFLDWNQPG